MSGIRLSGDGHAAFASRGAMLNRSFWKVAGCSSPDIPVSGSWLSLWLNSLELIRRDMRLSPTQASLFDQRRFKRVNQILRDIRDFQRFKFRAGRQPSDVVFSHGCAVRGPSRLRRPYKTYSSNVMGRSISWSRCENRAGRGVVVNVTTTKCYENKEWIAATGESDALGE